MPRIVIDVREPEEFAASHVENAINLPLSGLMSGQANLDTFPKDSEIVLYCNSGNRSGVAAQIFQSQGFTRVVNGINQVTVESMGEEA